MDTPDREDEIRQKRLATLLGAYRLLEQKYALIKHGCYLNNSQAAATVEDYLSERAAICRREKITGRIQRHKIAGLMASAIIKWKPIQINTTRDTLSNENEMLAVYHGLAICAEGQLEQLMAFISTQHFQKWVDDLVYLFRRRPSDAESFILVFETISLTHFPGNLVVED